jgi:hypothetical protein
MSLRSIRAALATVSWLQQSAKFNRENRFCLRQNEPNLQFSPLNVQIAPWGTVMKKTLLGVVAVAALMGTPALAADMALKAPPPPPPSASWTGCYIGANVGGIWEHDNTPITLFDPTGIATVAFTTGRIPSSFRYDRSSVVGGGQLGCNWQVTNWVVGIETDFDGTGLRGGQTISTAVPGFFR